MRLTSELCKRPTTLVRHASCRTTWTLLTSLAVLAGVTSPALARGAAARASGSPQLDSAIAPAESITLPSGGEQYVYVGSTAGGFAMDAVSWLQDLEVTASYSGNEAVSIGRSVASTGSYESAAGNHAIAGVELSGYKVVRTFSASASQPGPGYSGGPGTPAPGVSLSLPFKTKAADLVLIVIGGEGTGGLSLSGVDATTLQNATYSEAGGSVIASAAIYSASLPSGRYDAHWSSTTYLSNSGTSLGAVVYLLRPR